MRILTAIYGPDRGGSERAVLRLMRELTRLGHDIEIIGKTADGTARPFALARRLRRSIAFQRPDILFSPGQTYALPFAFARFAGRESPPLVTKISNMPGDDMLAQIWLKLQKSWTDRFVAPDAASARQLGVTLAALAARVVAIDNPCADRDQLLALHSAGYTSNPGLNVLAAGRVVPQKNFKSLMLAFSNIAGAGDRLTIIGGGPEYDHLQRDLHDRQNVHEFCQNVDLAGHVTNPAPYFAQANAFASSSLFEGLPAVLIEALAAGLPIAATDSSPAVRALFEDGKLGILVPVNDDDALASALAALRKFRPDRKAMLAAALRFTAEKAAPAYIDLFQGLVSEAKTSE